MTIIFVLILVAVFVIGWLCYAWMESTRASQRRTEAQNQRVVELLEEILRELGKATTPKE
jgi:CHASE3 domain sensor protein